MLPRPHHIRKRGEGELAVRAAFANAILIRPAVMFGPDDAFLTPILKLLRQLPVYPMFGRSLTRVWGPAHRTGPGLGFARVSSHTARAAALSARSIFNYPLTALELPFRWDGALAGIRYADQSRPQLEYTIRSHERIAQRNTTPRNRSDKQYKTTRPTSE
jgi:hypothetical protein